MKIVQVNDVVYAYASGDPSANGGAERYGWLLARAFARSGWTVTVGVRKGLREGERRQIDGVEFVGLGRGQVLWTWYRFLLLERPDWWLWHCAYHLWGPAAEMARLVGVRTAFSAMHDRDVQVRHALTRRRRWWPLYMWGLERTDVILVQHHGQLAALPLRWQSKAYILPGIVGQPTTVKPHADREKFVVWVAVMRPDKRPDLLIKIARRMPSTRFVVCGAAETRWWKPGQLEEIVEDLRALPNVEYLGHVPPQKTLEIIGQATMLLSTSDGEGFPSVFLEAWATGTPVVSLKIDPDDLINRIGLGAVSKSIEDAVENIGSLMESVQRRDEIAIRARRHVAEVHSERSAITTFECAIRGVGL